MKGVEQVAFSAIERCASVSLVSDGAEAVLINKRFFLQHLNDEKKKKLRSIVSSLLLEKVNFALTERK